MSFDFTLKGKGKPLWGFKCCCSRTHASVCMCVCTNKTSVREDQDGAREPVSGTVRQVEGCEADGREAKGWVGWDEL